MGRRVGLGSLVLTLLLVTSGCEDPATESFSLEENVSITESTRASRATPTASVPAGPNSSVPAPMSGDDAVLDEMFSRHRQCVEERGFAVVELDSGADGSRRFEYRASGPQQSALRQALEECYLEVGLLDGEPIEQPSKEYLSAYYDFLVDLALCVEGQGVFEIPDPPSREVFIESGGGAWHPYDQRWASASQEEMNRLNEVCPQDFRE